MKLISSALLFFAISFYISSCNRTVACDCKNHKGESVKYSEITSNRSDRDEFEAECRLMKVESYKDCVLVYTPCELIN